MTKTEIICKLRFMGFIKDEYPDFYKNKKGISIYFKPDNYVTVTTNILKYIEYNEVINYLITIDK